MKKFKDFKFWGQHCRATESGENRCRCTCLEKGAKKMRNESIIKNQKKCVQK